MKLKTLLASSAALLISASAAQAADAVVAEPEPNDYVKVCDMYGAGFYYIPGTETCLRVSGEFRIQYEYTTGDTLTTEVSTGTIDQYGDTIYEDKPVSSIGSPYWHARVNFDAREETDYGTLRTYMRFESTEDSSTPDYNEDDGDKFPLMALDAYIELGGLSVGRRTSRMELVGLPGLMYDGSYFGGGRTMYADYTFASNGLAILGGVSIDNDQEGGLDEEKSIDGYIRADYAGSNFNLGAAYGHDTSESEGALAFYANVTPMEGLLIQGYFNTQEATTQFGGDGDTQKWGVGASYALMHNVSVAGGYYHTDVDGDELDGYSLGLDWNVTNNLLLRLGYNHEDSESDEVNDYRVRLQSNF
ncbi:MAG: porin [Rhizobiaceae bacterium]